MSVLRRLGDVLAEDLDVVGVEPEGQYSIAGVYGFGRGLFGRGPISGSGTSYARLHRLHAGQMVMSRLKAFEGAVAVVPPEFEGWYLSPEFPTFRCIDGELDARYLAQVCRWPEFWDRLAGVSTGIGARRERVHAAHLLSLEVPLPSVAEQVRTAARLDALARSTVELRSLSSRAANLSDAWAASLCNRPDLSSEDKSALGWRRVNLGSILVQSVDRVRVQPDGEYPNIGIFSFGRGVFAKPAIEGSVTSATSLNRIRGGQFIYSRLFAFEGAYAHVPNEFDGYFVSNEFPTFDVDPDQSDARWLASYLRMPSTWAELGGSSKGLGVRRQRVPVEALLGYGVWLPPLSVQRRAVAALDRFGLAQARRVESTEHIDALVSSALNETFGRAS